MTRAATVEAEIRYRQDLGEALAAAERLYKSTTLLLMALPLRDPSRPKLIDLLSDLDRISDKLLRL
jgi:hypothetical protein